MAMALPNLVRIHTFDIVGLDVAGESSGRSIRYYAGILYTIYIYIYMPLYTNIGHYTLLPPPKHCHSILCLDAWSIQTETFWTHLQTLLL